MIRIVLIRGYRKRPKVLVVLRRVGDRLKSVGGDDRQSALFTFLYQPGAKLYDGV